MKKINCWEFHKCGREPGGQNYKELGPCPAAVMEYLDGINSGGNAGRMCWVVSGTYCDDKVQGSHALKLSDCLECQFFQLVREEEGPAFVLSKKNIPSWVLDKIEAGSIKKKILIPLALIILFLLVVSITGIYKYQQFSTVLAIVSVLLCGSFFLFFYYYINKIGTGLEKSQNDIITMINELDHTEYVLMENEEKFRLLSEQSLIGILILQNDVFKYANQAIADIMEFSVDELLNLPEGAFIDLIHDDDRELVVNQARKKQSGDSDIIINYTWRIITKSGKIKWVETYSKPINFRKKPANFINIIDITKRKKSEEKQNNLEMQLMQSQKMDSIGRLAGGIAHDFNNLLTIIIGFSEISLMKISGSEYSSDKELLKIKNSLKIINDAGDKAATLTSQLLAFSRKQVMEMKIVNLNIVVEDLAKMLRRLIGENITLEIKTHNSVRNILADTGQIEQIMMNLVINARDAISGNGRITIEVSNTDIDMNYEKIHPEFNPGLYTLISITDTGHGMSSEVKKKIFEPFFTTKGQSEGTGLGLSMVYGIVKQHEGYIYVISKTGYGSTFNIYFPAVEGEIKIFERNVTENMPGGNETILVAEDESIIRALISDILTPLGYNIITAENGAEALNIFQSKKERIDLLLTDMVMPEMDGFELADKLKKNSPDIKIIFMTGYIDNATTQEKIKKMKTICLMKPISPEMLINKIREILDKNLN